MFTLYISSFFLTLLGYLLGKSTYEEHNEIEKYIIVLSEFLKILFYAIVVYYFYNSLWIILFLVLFIFHIIGKYFKIDDITMVHDILLLGISIILFKNIQIELILILIFAIIFDKSLKQFNFKSEFYSLILYLIVYFGFMIF